MQYLRRTQRGFTLIELLVVVAILALLMSVLLPTLSRARQQGKAATCLANQRTLMQATFLYYQTHGDRLPSAGLTHGGQANDEERSWTHQMVADFGGQMDVLRCSSDTSRFWNTPVNPSESSENWRYRQSSYATNGYTAYAVADGVPVYNRMEIIPRPATTIFWVELVAEHVGASNYAAADHVHAESWWFGVPREVAREQVDLARHLDKANYAFLDGHAERLAFEETYQIDPQTGFPIEYWRNYYDPEIAR
jgi:prepilin-type N-terminal cleavage/methylation domain-containing protein/prepilin-type processing-associated H-X9-DG protein